MKGVSRLRGVPVLALMALVALTLGACGGEDEEVLGRASDELRLPSMAFFAPRGALPKKPSEPVDEPAPSAPTFTRIDEVRETGFEPAPGVDGEPECIDCVRETGFAPPVLELVAVNGDFAELRWAADADAERFRVSARRLASDGADVRSDEYIVTEARIDLPLEGHHTVARVEVVDENGKPISKPSNTVDIPR